MLPIYLTERLFELQRTDTTRHIVMLVELSAKFDIDWFRSVNLIVH